MYPHRYSQDDRAGRPLCMNESIEINFDRNSFFKIAMLVLAVYGTVLYPTGNK